MRLYEETGCLTREQNNLERACDSGCEPAALTAIPKQHANKSGTAEALSLRLLFNETGLFLENCRRIKKEGRQK